MELSKYLGKEVEIHFYRRKYQDGVLIHKGKLMDIQTNSICLLNESNRYIWVKRPRAWDSIKEIE